MTKRQEEFYPAFDIPLIKIAPLSPHKNTNTRVPTNENTCSELVLVEAVVLLTCTSQNLFIFGYCTHSHNLQHIKMSKIFNEIQKMSFLLSTPSVDTKYIINCFPYSRQMRIWHNSIVIGIFLFSYNQWTFFNKLVGVLWIVAFGSKIWTYWWFLIKRSMMQVLKLK